jgi:hypothetical protein
VRTDLSQWGLSISRGLNHAKSGAGLLPRGRVGESFARCVARTASENFGETFAVLKRPFVFVASIGYQVGRAQGSRIWGWYVCSLDGN